MFHVADPTSVGIFKEQDAKLGVLGADLLRDVDLSLPPWERHKLNQGRLPLHNMPTMPVSSTLHFATAR